MNSNDLPLHLKYRPETFDEIIGNEETINSLKSVINREVGRPHTFLLQGVSGSGKTTTGRIISNELGANHADIFELNISDMRGIETARSIIENASYPPLYGQSKVFVLNECHKGNDLFWNCLLEILEEPPEHAFFILCTTEPAKIPKAVKTRCSVFQFNLLQRGYMTKLIKDVLHKEGVELSSEILNNLVKKAEGCPRQALVLLDKIIDLTDDKILETLDREEESDNIVFEICQDLLKKKSWKELSDKLKTVKDEYESVRLGIVGYFTTVLLGKEDDKVAEMMECFMNPWYDTGKSRMVHSCYMACIISHH